MCTTAIFTRGTIVDDSTLVTHSDDDELGDQRIIFVPAQDHEPGSRRQVLGLNALYPRMVTDQRGPGYEPPSPDYPMSKPIGWIPQVGHTYSYFDGNYGICNEHNLMLGECTNKAKYEPDPVTAEEAEKTGKHVRFFYSSELSRIALERCRTAREAIKVMGDLIDEFGLYSTGETLLVVDENEGWVFEMCALPDEELHSAWVAQRVPEGEVFVAANEFRIREVEKESPDFKFSKHLFAGLEKVRWWKPQDGPLDWLRAVSPGEYGHPYYSLRRVWRFFDRVNPDRGLSPWVEDGYTRDYPFSLEPNRKLEIREVFDLYRDHYEGTPFDLTRGVGAGPYGDPHRLFGPYDSLDPVVVDGEPRGVCGAWERPISVFYQGYTYVGQIRPEPEAPEATRGVLWFGPDVSYTTCFTPFFTKVAKLPRAYQSGSPQKFDREAAWWAFDFVGNWCRLNFQRMTRVDILPLQAELELELLGKLAEIDAVVENDPGHAIEAITKFCEENAGRVLHRWWQLADTLIAKYSNGYVNLPDGQPPREVGYPSAWLQATNYKDGPTTYARKP